jgi:hypothetical protein
MTIPAWTPAGILPPFLGTEATHRQPGSRSPYPVTLHEMVTRFSTSSHRIALMIGFINFRKALHAEGLVTGMQWLDGSFVEDIEHHRPARPNPGDIDVVTILPAPGPGDITPQREQLFDPAYTKAAFHVDSYPIEVDGHIPNLVDDVTYWYGLFSHRRTTFEWKGILAISLTPDGEDDALQFLTLLT